MSEKLVNNRIFEHLQKYGPFLISSKVLGLLNQLQIFSQLYLIELLGLLTGLGLLSKFKSYGISGQIFGLVFFSVIDGFEWF